MLTGANWSTEGCHIHHAGSNPPLSRLENKNTYAGTVLIDLSSASNTIMPQQLVEKVRVLNVDAGTRDWILDRFDAKKSRLS